MINCCISLLIILHFAMSSENNIDKSVCKRNYKNICSLLICYVTNVWYSSCFVIMKAKKTSARTILADEAMCWTGSVWDDAHTYMYARTIYTLVNTHTYTHLILSIYVHLCMCVPTV